jgi:adenosylcobinamide kinase/adenosylcobinamide-phosphate guanylyltransferase
LPATRPTVQLRVPGMTTVEEPLALAQAIAAAQPRLHTLVVVDCLTLWLTNC